MFFTRVLAAPKSKYVGVMVESLVSGHQTYLLRERKGDKLEVVLFDPYIRQKVVYKEVKRLRGVECTNFKPADTLESLES